MKKVKVELLVGIPGSGKSTYRRTHPDAFVISRDDIRKEISHGNEYNFTNKNEEIVSGIVRDRFYSAVISNADHILFDECNCSPMSRKHNLELIETTKNSVTNVEFDIVWTSMNDSFNVELCHERNIKRNRLETVPYHVIERMYRGFIEFSREKNPQDWFPEYHSANFDLPKAIIIDVDGTIAAKSKERGYFEYDKAGEDRPITETIELIRELPYEKIIMTGRLESSKDVLVDWLGRVGLPYNHIFMRPNERKFEKDYSVKLRTLKNCIQPYYNVVGIFEDRMQAVRAYRAFGFKVYQVDLGMF